MKKYINHNTLEGYRQSTKEWEVKFEYMAAIYHRAFIKHNNNSSVLDAAYKGGILKLTLPKADRRTHSPRQIANYIPPRHLQFPGFIET